MQENDEKNALIESLLKKVEFLRVHSDKYWSIKKIVDLEPNKSYKNIESSIEMDIIDAAFPLIRIPKYQLVSLQNSSKGTECVRKLIDFLFEEEVFAGKSSTFIKQNFEEKYKLILRYATKNFSMKQNEINKCITNKCTQTKIKDGINDSSNDL